MMIDSVRESEGSEPGCKRTLHSLSPSLCLPLSVPHKSKNDYTCKYTGPRFRHQLCFTEIPPYILFIYESVRVKNRKQSARFAAPESGENQFVARDRAPISREIPKINTLSGFFSCKLRADVCAIYYLRF